MLYNSVSALAALGAEGPIAGLQYLMAVLSFFTVVFGGLAVGVLTGVFSGNCSTVPSASQYSVAHPIVRYILSNVFIIFRWLLGQYCSYVLLEPESQVRKQNITKLSVHDRMRNAVCVLVFLFSHNCSKL